MGEGEGGMIWDNGIETCILSYVIIYDMIIYDIIYNNHILSSPVQVQCMIQDARGRCTLMTQRDGMGREVGGGIQDGEPMDIHGRLMSMYGKNHYNIVT